MNNKKVIPVAMYCRMARDNDEGQSLQEQENFPQERRKARRASSRDR